MKSSLPILQCKTRGGANKKGLSRLYFCCHKDDFEKYFEPVTDNLLQIKENAAIWHRDPSKSFQVTEQFLDELQQMQLFIIPVTRLFLYDNDPARNIELSYAIFHHIPVFPLLQDEGDQWYAKALALS